MARATYLTNANRNRACDAVTVRANGGILRIYDGTVPADANTALSTQNILAELNLGNPAFAASGSGGSPGVAPANAITTDASANNTGTPTFFRVFESDGTTVAWQGTAGASGCDLNVSGLTSGQIIAGGAVSISAFSHTQPALG